MRFAVGVLVGFYAGLLAAAILFAKTERMIETGTFAKLQLCKARLDEMTNEVGQYARAIEEIPQIAEYLKAASQKGER